MQFPTAFCTTAQSKCTITPKSPTYLTAAGGKLVNNTKNVMIACQCIMGRGGLFKKINWFTSDGNAVDRLGSAHDGAPYTDLNYRRRIVTLIIPKFIEEYSDTYICSSGLVVPHRLNRATIDLILCM